MKDTLMIRQPLYFKTILDFFGGKQKLVKALGISVNALYKWRHIPEQRAYQIEVLSNGRFRSQDILKWGEYDLNQRSQVE